MTLGFLGFSTVIGILYQVVKDRNVLRYEFALASCESIDFMFQLASCPKIGVKFGQFVLLTLCFAGCEQPMDNHTGFCFTAILYKKTVKFDFRLISFD